MKYIISPLATVILATILFAFQMTMCIESILLSLLPFIGLILLLYYLFLIEEHIEQKEIEPHLTQVD